MRWNKKMPSFTLSEMLVVLLITTVVVGIAYTVLVLVIKYKGAIENRYEQQQEMRVLKHRLTYLLNTNEHTQISNLDNGLLFTTDTLQTRMYINEDHVIIDEDTLSLALYDQTYFYKGEEVIAGAVDAVSLQLEQKNLERMIFAFTHLSSKQKGTWD